MTFVIILDGAMCRQFSYLHAYDKAILRFINLYDDNHKKILIFIAKHMFKLKFMTCYYTQSYRKIRRFSFDLNIIFDFIIKTYLKKDGCNLQKSLVINTTTLIAKTIYILKLL